MTDAVVWVPVRNGGIRYRYHDRPECMTHPGSVPHVIPTLERYAKALGFERCAICVHRDVVERRRKVVVKLRHDGLTFPQIARQIAASFDVGASLVHKDFHRAEER